MTRPPSKQTTGSPSGKPKRKPASRSGGKPSPKAKSGKRVKRGANPMKARPKKKASVKVAPRKRDASKGVRVRWRGARADDVFGGGVHHFNAESLARGIEQLLNRYDTLIGPSLRSVLGEVTSDQLTFMPLGSDAASYRIRVSASNAKKREASVVLVVARRDGDLSKRLEREYGHMEFCQAQAPKRVCSVYRNGLIFVPKIRDGAKGGRKVFAYTEEWLGAANSLSVDASGQFRVLAEKSRLLSRAQSEDVRAAMLETSLRIYDGKTGTGLAVRRTTPDCWAATGRADGSPTIVLMRCPGLMSRCTPARYLNAAIQYRWPGEKGDIPVGPLEAESVVQAAKRAWGVAEANEVLRAYAQGVRKDRYPQPSEGLLPLLEL